MHLPRVALPPSAVTSCCATVLCRKGTSRVPPCLLPRGPCSPPLWEIPSATRFSHDFPLETADQGHPPLLANILLLASSLPFDSDPPSNLGCGAWAETLFAFLSCPGICPGDPDLPGFQGPLLTSSDGGGEGGALPEEEGTVTLGAGQGTLCRLCLDSHAHGG